MKINLGKIDSRVLKEINVNFFFYLDFFWIQQRKLFSKLNININKWSYVHLNVKMQSTWKEELLITFTISLWYAHEIEINSSYLYSNKTFNNAFNMT